MGAFEDTDKRAEMIKRELEQKKQEQQMKEAQEKAEKAQKEASGDKGSWI